jgi:hypothetical protein
MKANVGSVDATIRWTLAIIFFGLAIAFNSAPAIALVTALLALVMAGTALTKVCPLYTALGLDTARHGTPGQPGEKPAR